MPQFYPLLVALIVLLSAAWEPFDFTLDVGTLVGKVRALRLDPWQVGSVRDEGVELVRYALFGLAASLWLRQIGARSSTILAAAGGATVAGALEASQWIIGSRMPGLEDAAVHAAGAVAGAALSRRWPWNRSPIFWCVVLWCATGLGAALQRLSPFEIAADASASHVAAVLERLRAHADRNDQPRFRTGADLRPARICGIDRERPAMGNMDRASQPTLLVAAPLEYLQGWIVGRYGDVTDVAIAGLGAVVGVWIAGSGALEFCRPQESGGSPVYGRR